MEFCQSEKVGTLVKGSGIFKNCRDHPDKCNRWQHFRSNYEWICLTRDGTDCGFPAPVTAVKYNLHL